MTTVEAEATRLEPGRRVASLATIAAYAVLGATLLVTRLIGLDRSYWLDEIIGGAEYVQDGPSRIMTGEGLQHQLYLLLGWATTFLIGESEIALRLWSVIPFVAGVALVTFWLHRRVGTFAGALFLSFCTFSPLLLDITRQARGYGLAFLAMAVLVVATLEAERTDRRPLVAVACVAGVAGTWTLPQLSVAFLATTAVLLISRTLRRAAAAGMAASLVAITAWYAPRMADLREKSEIEYGTQISTIGLPSAAFDQVLIPALLWIDGTVVVLRPIWLPVIAALAVLLASSALLRDRASALVLLAGPLATFVAVWIAGIYAVPRYLSFLLVPLFVLLATGIAAILRRLAHRPPIVRTLIAVGVLATTFVVFVRSAPDVLRLPREAHRDAAAAILENAPPTAPVFAYMTRPEALAFYLGRPVVRPASASDASVCDRRELVALVVQPWVLPTAEFTCMERGGTTRYRFEQYARGGEIAVWIIPARP